MDGRPAAVLLGGLHPAGKHPELLGLLPDEVWQPAYDSHDQIRDGAWVAELTDLLDLTSWLSGMRVIARKERPPVPKWISCRK